MIKKIATKQITRTDVENLENSLSQSLSQASTNPQSLTQGLKLPTEFNTSPLQSGRGLTKNLEPPTASSNIGYGLPKMSA